MARQKLIVTLSYILGGSCLSQGQILADSISQFSGTQGQSGWNYGYYDKTGDTPPPVYALSDFQLMTQYDGTTWWVNNVDNTTTGFFTRLYATGGHSNGLDNYPGRTRALREHFAVRRWTSTYSGLVQIDIKHHKIDPAGSGTNFILYRNAAALFNPNFGNMSTSPTNYTFTTNIASGDKLDLFLDSWMAQDANDNSHLSMKITVVPEPMTLSALAVGASALVRRRRARKH